MSGGASGHVWEKWLQGHGPADVQVPRRAPSKATAVMNWHVLPATPTPAEAQGTEAQRRKGAEARKHGGAETQRRERAKAPGHGG
eukprot:CAMPEP_0197925754 /NCGR_PEP_ID=MMETSP1439-20131203/98012_1 /TAXON_ID=66791 /ORGANISM="Gonyaulax spinifera, Strain CCMP409" /LENGTH=84 /DNA_ID=CAMNT_0043548251 /DNA_START=132 /DNA_END=383 /DNA_ORIENTATION=-